MSAPCDVCGACPCYEHERRTVIVKKVEPRPILKVEGPDRMTFYVSQGEVLRFEPNGDIYVQGRLAANDLEVVDAIRTWARSLR